MKEKLDELKEKLSKAWVKETSNSPDKWKKTKPSIGQCAVTSILVNEMFGGLIIRGEFASKETHYWNLLDKEIIDLTRDQFNKEELSFEAIGVRSREYLLKDKNTKKRYELLKELLLKVNVEESAQEITS